MKTQQRNNNIKGVKIKDHEKLPKHVRDAYPNGIFPKYLMDIAGWKNQKDMDESEERVVKELEKMIKRNNKGIE